MARKRSQKLYSLAQVAEKTGISLASLRRYRAQYPERVPSVGVRRGQRFPEAALPVFRELKEEGMARRGRRRSTGVRRPGGATAGRSKVRAKKRRTAERASAGRRAGADRESLLTLVQIGRMTGISYPTLLRYVRLHLDRLPHSGSGRKRRFRPAAVREFQKLREESRRGRHGGPAPVVATPVTRQLAKLERGQRALARQLRDLRRAMARPLRIKLER